MKSPYRLVKDLWQLLPVSATNRLRRVPVIGGFVNRVSASLMRNARHDEIYDARYYDYVDAEAAAAAPVMVASLIARFSPQTLVDVGCGTGAFLAEAQRRGLTVHGLEYSNAGIARARQKGVSVAQFDLTTAAAPTLPRPRFDLVTSFEVAEHLDAALADNYVNLLASLGGRIVMTAAVPGQGGMNHVNEQPNSYWIAKLEQRGFRHVPALTQALRQEWTPQLQQKWFGENVLVFEATR